MAPGAKISAARTGFEGENRADGLGLVFYVAGLLEIGVLRIGAV